MLLFIKYKMFKDSDRNVEYYRSEENIIFFLYTVLPIDENLKLMEEDSQRNFLNRKS